MVSPVNLYLESLVASMSTLHSLLHSEVPGSAARQPFARSQLFGVLGEEYVMFSDRRGSKPFFP